MKFTVAIIGVACLSTAWAGMMKKVEDQKDKRDAPVGYPSSGHSSHTFQIQPSLDEGSAISIGAGYSVGGAKPSYVYEGASGAAPAYLSAGAVPASDHATIQLAPITLQPEHGNIIASDLSQLMSQLSHGLSSGSLTLSPGGSIQAAGQHSSPQFAYGSPKMHYSLSDQGQIASPPSYAAGTKGLGSYGSTGPVLFNPANAQAAPQSLSYAPSSGHGVPDISQFSGLTLNSGHSAPTASLGHSLNLQNLQAFGGASLSGHSYGGPSLGGSHGIGGYTSAAPSLGAHSPASHSFGHSLGGLSLGSSGYTFGAPLKSFSGHSIPTKTSFKPSAYIGSSSFGDSSHSSSGVSPSYGGLSIGHGHSSPGHNVGLGSHSFGSSYAGSVGAAPAKFSSHSYLPAKSEGYSGAADSLSAFSSAHSSPAGGAPHSGSQGASGVYTPHSNQQYYVSSNKLPSSLAYSSEGSVSYKAPSSGHGSLSSLTSGPKYSFGSHSHSPSHSPRYSAQKDAHGAYSENTYNTIKYSEDIKPRNH